MLMTQCCLHPVQVPWWPFDFAPAIKPKFKELWGEGGGERGAVNKNDKFQWGGHSFSTWDLSKSFQNTCLNHFHCQLRLKNAEIP